MESSSTMHARAQGADGSAADPAESSAPSEETFRSHFASWLGGMSDEVRQLAFLLEREEASAPARRLAADSLNQLLHAADLLPEGTEALGYLETSFAFRMLAAELAEAAFSAPRLPKPRRPKVEPAGGEPLPPLEAAEPLAAHAGAEGAVSEGSVSEGSVSEGSVSEGAAPGGEGLEAESAEAEAGVAGEAGPSPAEEVQALADEAVAVQAERAEGSAVELPAAADEVEEAAPEAGVGEAEAASAEASVEESSVEAAGAEAGEAGAPQMEEQPEEEPEPAQASDESYAVVRRLAPQAALVRAFLGADDAERLRRLVLEQRSRPSRGRSSKDILFSGEARAAAASEAREWAEHYVAPEFGSMQHDLLRLRTFMKTRVRRTTS